MEIVIREMLKKDWPEVAKIFKQGIDTGLARFEGVVPPYEEWDGDHLKCCRFVALNGNKIAGWAALSVVSGRAVFSGVAELSLYIEESCRHMGVGKALIRKTLDESEKADIWSVLSVIMEDNLPSIRLHEKCGFRMIGFRERVAKDFSGKWRNTVEMERRSENVGND